VWTTGGGRGEVKTRPLVSEVRPLIDGNQNRTECSGMSWNQDQTYLLRDLPQNQNQTTQDNQDQLQPPQIWDQSQENPYQLQQEVREQETFSAQLTPRPSPLKKKAQTAVEPRKNIGLGVRAVSSHLMPGLQKAQSVHSLLTDTGKTLGCPNKTVVFLGGTKDSSW